MRWYDLAAAWSVVASLSKKLVHKHLGLHVPQIIMPLHYASRSNMGPKFSASSRGWENTTVAMFHNEVLGESCDVGSKLVTETDLRKVAILGPRTEEAAVITQMQLP